ncbi:MAG TPA: PilZ domain-containing protein [Steroidobacteraceae bacterium]|nr:PilZ domain-containing protein [Steroidobacteraceae bacterium]
MTARFDGLGYTDALPLGFERLERLPEGPALAGIILENQQVLVADASLDEQRPHQEKKSDDEPELAEDLQRLEFKVNVLIQLVARLLNRGASLPPVRHLRFHAQGLEWRLDDEEVQPGVGLVHLHVSRYFPQPLVLPGRILGAHDDDEGRWARFAFEGLSPAVVDLIERMIFRHHRRLVAGTRTNVRG